MTSSKLFLPEKLIEHTYRRNIHQAGPGAATATHAAQVIMGFQNISAFAHETVALAQGAAFSEIMPTCHIGKLIQLTGIPGTYTASAGQI